MGQIRRMKMVGLLLVAGCSPQADYAERESLQGSEDNPNANTDTGALAADSAEVVSWNPPTRLECGESGQAELVMRNTGTATWTRDGAYKLGAVADSDPFIGNDPRVWLPESAVVFPGAEWTFEIDLSAPDSAGSYTTDWQMVHEYVNWFGESVATDILVECTTPPDDTPTSGEWVTEACARNGSEICDDEVFGVEAGVQYGLLCAQAGGGISYVSRNTGPTMSDGMERCQGWEENGQNAWDHLDYISKTICENEGDVLEIDLSDYVGGHLWFGSHDLPDGGGDMTNTCLARLE